MLVDLILNLIYTTINEFLLLLPDVALPNSVLASASTASTYLSALSSFTPVSNLLLIIGLVLVVEGVILTIKIVNWFIRKIPTVN